MAQAPLIFHIEDLPPHQPDNPAHFTVSVYSCTLPLDIWTGRVQNFHPIYHGTFPRLDGISSLWATMRRAWAARHRLAPMYTNWYLAFANMHRYIRIAGAWPRPFQILYRYNGLTNMRIIGPNYRDMDGMIVLELLRDPMFAGDPHPPHNEFFQQLAFHLDIYARQLTEDPNIPQMDPEVDDNVPDEN